MMKTLFASAASFAIAETLLVLTSPAAHAQVTFYTSLAAFQSAASDDTTVKSTFESFPFGVVGNTLSDGGLTFTNNGGGPLFIFDTRSGGTSPNPTSKVLTANANERFDITFGGANPTVVGFDTYTNNSLAPVVSVFGITDTLLGSFTLTQGPNTLGFFGVTSASPIGRVLWSATNGNLQDTAIDNVRTGAVSAAAPEPSALTFLALSALGVVVARRRKTR